MIKVNDANRAIKDKVGMTREDAIKHLENMKWLLGVNNTTVDDIPLTKVIDDIAALLEALPPTHIHEEYPEHDWYKNEDGTINRSAMDCDTHSGPVCKRCGDSFCVFCEPNGFETHKPCVIDEFACPECGGMVLNGQKYCSRCGRGMKWK